MSAGPRKLPALAIAAGDSAVAEGRPVSIEGREARRSWASVPAGERNEFSDVSAAACREDVPRSKDADAALDFAGFGFMNVFPFVD